MAQQEDLVFARAAVSLGLLDSKKLASFLQLQNDLVKSGQYVPLPSLLLNKGILTNDQVQQIQKSSTKIPNANESLDQTTVEQQGQAGIQLEVVGKNLGRYKILQELGKGGMGLVYKAYDPVLDRTVALKTLLSTTSELDEKRFLREAKAVAKLQHPNIVGLHEIGSQDGCPFFTMDLIEGVSLQEWMKSHNVTSRQAAEVMAKTAKAIHYAHQSGVVHRDLKPANIMLTPDNQPKVMDFGLAKIRGRETTKLSQEGTVLGTLYYMPPEQAEGNLSCVDERSDVYALGAILYELLTGRPPFTGKTFSHIMMQVLNQQPEAPSSIRRKIPQALELICLKAIEKNKEHRYQTAEELANDLLAFLAGRKVKASRRWHPNKKSVAILASSALSVLVLIIFLLSRRSVSPIITNVKEDTVVSNSDKTETKQNHETTSQIEPAPITANNDAVEPESLPKSKLHFPSDHELPLEKRPELKKVWDYPARIEKLKSTQDKKQLAQVALEYADLCRDLRILEKEILALQEIPSKSDVILLRLAECCLEGKMYMHAKYYLDEMLLHFPDSPLIESGQKQLQLISQELRVDNSFSGERKTVWKMLRYLAHARLAVMNQQYQSSKDFLANAYTELEKANLKEFLPTIAAFKIIIHVYLKEYSTADKLIATTLGYKISENRQIHYPRLSTIRIGSDNLYATPEFAFARSILYIFGGQAKQSNNLFDFLEKRINNYPSSDNEMMRLVKQYKSKDIDWKNQKQMDTLRLELPDSMVRLAEIFMIRGLMNAKKTSKKGDAKKTLEDILNLEIAPYMINLHLGGVYFEEKNYQKAIEHLTVSRRLFPEDGPIFFLAKIAHGQGYPEQAKKYLEYCQKHPPVSSFGESVKKQIQDMLKEVSK